MVIHEIEQKSTEMLLFHLALSLGAAQAVTAFSCTTQFWPTLNPGENFTVDAQCQFYPGYPRTVGNTKVSVAYTDNWGDHARTNNLLTRLPQSLTIP